MFSLHVQRDQKSDSLNFCFVSELENVDKKIDFPKHQLRQLLVSNYWAKINENKYKNHNALKSAYRVLTDVHYPTAWRKNNYLVSFPTDSCLLPHPPRLFLRPPLHRRWASPGIQIVSSYATTRQRQSITGNVRILPRRDREINHMKGTFDTALRFDREDLRISFALYKTFLLQPFFHSLSCMYIVSSKRIDYEISGHRLAFGKCSRKNEFRQSLDRE